MKCAMVILNYNDSRRALKLAEKCCIFSAIDKVVVVDNKSTDDSKEYLKNRKTDTIDLCFATDNKGFAAGNNIGAKYMIEKYSPRYLLFANTDTIFDDEDVFACIKALDDNETIGLVSMRMKNINGNEERAAWKYKSFWQYLLFNFWIYRYHNYMSDLYNYNEEEKIQPVDMVRGSFMMFRAEALKRADYFDEGTFLYYEEECISYRLMQHGYGVGIITNHFYVHNHISSAKKNIRFIKKTYDESLIHFLKKYYNIGAVKSGLFRLATKISFAEMILAGVVKSKRR